MFEVQIVAARVEDCSSWWANLRPQTVVFGKVLWKKSCLDIYIWVVVKIMVPFWIPITIRHLIYRVTLNPKP